MHKGLGIKDPIRQWGVAWFCLAVACGLHVTDEALTGFLPLYNSTITSLRENHGWIPFPVFSFPVWLGGLIVLIIVLLVLTPFVLRGDAWLRPVSYILGVIMVGNALGHMAASLYWSTLAPGVYSSPLLLAAAIGLLVTTRRSRSIAEKSE